MCFKIREILDLLRKQIQGWLAYVDVCFDAWSCICPPGGPRAAHEAQEFMWNEHVVIPVKCTGGAAGGKFDVPEEIFKVSQRLWKTSCVSCSFPLVERGNVEVSIATLDN